MNFTKNQIGGQIKYTSNAKWTMRVNCPFCNDTKYHLYINEESDFAYCQRCKAKINLKNNDECINIDRSDYIPRKNERIWDNKLPKHTYKIDLETDCYIQKEVLQYLYSRYITDKDIEDYDIHYNIKSKRVVFPFYQDNKLVYYVSRAIDNTLPKTLNPCGKKNVYNIENASKYDSVILTEGVFDVIMTGKNAIAVLGKTITDYQILVLRQYLVKNIYIMLDPIEKIKESYDIASRLKYYFDNIYIIKLDYNNISSIFDVSHYSGDISKIDPGDICLRRYGYIDEWKDKLNVIKFKEV